MFAEEKDFEIVGFTGDPITLMLAVKALRADVVVLASEESSNVALASHLFGEYPSIILLALSSGGAVIEQLCPVRRFVLDGSPDGILAALRAALAHPCQD